MNSPLLSSPTLPLVNAGLLSKWQLLCLFFLAAFAGSSLGQDRREDWVFEHEGCRFSAVLDLPSGEGPHPCLVLVPGSGQNKRDGMVAIQGNTPECLYPDLAGDTLYPYRELAVQLSARGLAVLRYDELAHSCPQALDSLSFSRLWLPAASAMKQLAKHPAIDGQRLIFLGHSEGGALLPYLAEAAGNCAGLIGLAAPYRPLDSLMVWQLREFAQRCPTDGSVMREQATQIEAYFGAVRQGNFTPPGFPLGGVNAELWQTYLMKMDAAGSALRVRSEPRLMIGLGNDYNVPGEELESWRKALHGTKSQCLEIPGLTHYLNPSNRPGVDPAIADAILAWLQEQALIKK